MAVSAEIQEKMLEEATSATPNFKVDTTDERFQQAVEGVDKAQTEYNATMGGMINGVDGYYTDVKDTLQQQADKLAQIQQDNTDFAIEKIEQEKDKAHKDYIKEQSGAYTDWRKQSNQYGADAEKMASAGLANTGYSESSQVAMYNTYQNRIATARESLNNVIMNYNNNIKEAQLQNNAALAQIYTDLAVKQAELTLEGALYKNQLIQDLAKQNVEFENTKWNRWQDVYQQINTENQLAWDATKYYDNQKWQTEQNELAHKRQLERDEINNKFSAAQAELDRKHEIAMFNAKTKAEKEAADLDYKRQKELLAQQHKNDLAELDKQLANDKALYSYQKSQSGGGAEITGGGSSKSGAGSAVKSVTIGGASKIASSSKSEVNTAYYQGSLNKDAKTYGTFDNGYQPKGISGHGKVSKTGDTITFKTETLSGQKQTVTQNIWKTPDGKKWYWDGRYNKYIQIKK